MNDDELRLLIRAAIQRHMGAAGIPLAADGRVAPKLAAHQASESGLSFAQYHLVRPSDDTMCIIEPSVQCNHCGFCKCHGH